MAENTVQQLDAADCDVEGTATSLYVISIDVNTEHSDWRYVTEFDFDCDTKIFGLRRVGYSRHLGRAMRCVRYDADAIAKELRSFHYNVWIELLSDDGLSVTPE